MEVRVLSAALRNWFGRSPAALQAVVQPNTIGPLAKRDLGPTLAVAGEPRTAWPPSRLAITDQLWGSGYIIPGGEIETLRLTRSFGLTSASSLLLVGAGGGGVACSIVRDTGAWVNGLEVDPALVKKSLAVMKAAQLGKKASAETWDPEHPKFASRRYHHCLALEALRTGDPPEPILDALARTIKTGGQLVMTELVADKPLPTNDPMVVRWGRLERRRLAKIPTANAISRMLARVGFDVRIAEDISNRHRHDALLGWRVVVRELAEQRPDPMLAAQLVAEAEMWLLRMRLLQDQRLKMMRWHAIA